MGIHFPPALPRQMSTYALGPSLCHQDVVVHLSICLQSLSHLCTSTPLQRPFIRCRSISATPHCLQSSSRKSALLLIYTSNVQMHASLVSRLHSTGIGRVRPWATRAHPNSPLSIVTCEQDLLAFLFYLDVSFDSNTPSMDVALQFRPYHGFFT